MKRTRPEFNGDLAYFTSNITVAADGSSPRSNEAFMAKIQLTWFRQYLSSAVQEFITISNAVYLD